MVNIYYFYELYAIIILEEKKLFNWKEVLKVLK